MESILTSIKKLLGITEDYTHFDDDLIIHINSVFMILNQLGIGPEKPFVINDDSAYWEDFIADPTELQAVKSYMAKRVGLLFDPPDRSVIADAANRNVAELEWRLYIEAETKDTE